MASAIVENGAIIFQSGCHGSFVGRLDIEVRDRRIRSYRHRLVPVEAGLEEDATMKALVERAVGPSRDLLGEVVGSVSAPLHRYSMLSAPMDDVLLEAIGEAAGTEIAFSNGWRYGAPIAAGPVTLNDLWNIVPTNPPVSTVELTGAEMRRMLEENLERTFAADAYQQMGGYVKRMRGLKLYFKAENPAGRRIDRLFAGAKPVDDDRVYRVGFITAQGVPQKFGRNRRELDVDAVGALRSLFSGAGTVRPAGEATVYEV
jgi:2',3'-cyclic-nucleotide 2'-phosphodiesterase (5'-nucleotidase family)